MEHWADSWKIEESTRGISYFNKLLHQGSEYSNRSANFKCILRTEKEVPLFFFFFRSTTLIPFSFSPFKELTHIGNFELSPYVCLSHAWLFVTDPKDYSLPGSSIHGISQDRILEWVSISFSRGYSWPRDWICVSCNGRWILYHWATWPDSKGKMFL